MNTSRCYYDHDHPHDYQIHHDHHTHNTNGDSAKENQMKNGRIELEAVAVVVLIPALVVPEISALRGERLDAQIMFSIMIIMITSDHDHPILL